MLRRAGSNVRAAITKLERERKKLEAQELQMMAKIRRQESTAKGFADLRPGLLRQGVGRVSAPHCSCVVIKSVCYAV